MGSIHQVEFRPKMISLDRSPEKSYMSSSQCPLRVRLGQVGVSGSLPLRPYERTPSSTNAMRKSATGRHTERSRRHIRSAHRRTRLGLLGFPPAIFTNYWAQDSHLCASQRSVRLSFGSHAGPWAPWEMQLLFRHRNTQVLCAMHSPCCVSRTTAGGSAST